MKGVFVHDETGKLKSFGILAETGKVRGGMHQPEGASVISVDIAAGEVEKLRAMRGHIAANLAIAGTPKDARLKHPTGR